MAMAPVAPSSTAAAPEWPLAVHVTPPLAVAPKALPDESRSAALAVVQSSKCQEPSGAGLVVSALVVLSTLSSDEPREAPHPAASAAKTAENRRKRTRV